MLLVADMFVTYYSLWSGRWELSSLNGKRIARNRKLALVLNRLYPRFLLTYTYTFRESSQTLLLVSEE